MSDVPTDHPSERVNGPVMWPPLLCVAWAFAPVLIFFSLGATDWRSLLLYLWAWSVVIVAPMVAIGALVVLVRYRRHESEGRFRRRLWYWVGGVYAAAAIAMLALLI